MAQSYTQDKGIGCRRKRRRRKQWQAQRCYCHAQLTLGPTSHASPRLSSTAPAQAHAVKMWGGTWGVGEGDSRAFVEKAVLQLLPAAVTGRRAHLSQLLHFGASGVPAILWQLVPAIAAGGADVGAPCRAPAGSSIRRAARSLREPPPPAPSPAPH